MPLHFSLEKHFAKEKVSQYFIRSKPESIITEEDFINLMSYGSSFTKADIAGVFELMKDIFLSELKKGNAIRTPWGKFTPTLSGKFTNNKEKVLSKNRKIRIKYSVSKPLLKILQAETKLRKTTFSSRKPYIESVLNLSHPTRSSFHNMELVQLQGKHLKIDMSNPSTGIILTKGNNKFPIPNNLITVSESKKIHFQLMNIPPGRYAIEVTSKVGKAIRTYKSEPILEIR